MKKLLIILLSITLIMSAFAGCQEWVDWLSPENTAGTTQSASVTPSEDTLRVSYIDVGQGDSILIQYPNGKVMLIDAAKKKDVGAVVDYLNSRNIKTIDYLIATHPHEDHIGGMETVIDTFNIGKVYMPRKEHDTKTFLNMLEAIERKNLKISTAKAGVEIDGTGDCRTYIISPAGNDYEEINDYSAVVRIEYGGTSFLFMGDAEELIEKEIMAALPQELSADVLKVGHHGSNTSSSEAFLKAAAPAYAVVSVGKDNEYGHPTKKILKRFGDLNIKLYRTDNDGNVMAVSDGVNVEIYTNVE